MLIVLALSTELYTDKKEIKKEDIKFIRSQRTHKYKKSYKTSVVATTHTQLNITLYYILRTYTIYFIGAKTGL